MVTMLVIVMTVTSKAGATILAPESYSKNNATLNNERIITSIEVIVPDEIIIEEPGWPSHIEIITQKGVNGEETFYREHEAVIHAGELEVRKYDYSEITVPAVPVIKRIGVNTEIIDGVDPKVIELEKERKIEKERKAKEAAEKKKREQNKNNNNSVSGGKVTTPEENKAYARSILSDTDFQCLDNLAKKESNWRTTAENKSSGAYGVPQALPGNKMASAGSDWRTNGKTQVNWMISYTKNRYGGPCEAWNAWKTKGWY